MKHPNSGAVGNEIHDAPVLDSGNKKGTPLGVPKMNKSTNYSTYFDDEVGLLAQSGLPVLLLVI